WSVGSLGSVFAAGISVLNNGALYLSGGTLNAATITTGGGGFFSFGSGTLNITGGNLSVGSTGFLGSNLQLSPTRVLSVAGTTTIQPGSTLQINSTTFTTGTLVNNGGQLVFPSGTIQITSSALTIGPGGPFGNTLQLSSGQNVFDTYGVAQSSVG